MKRVSPNLIPEGTGEPKTRLRIRFTKCGDLRWISHRDLQRLWERLLRRADLQLAFSQGFHPKPLISFPSALALGVEALDEVIELELLGVVEPAAIESVIRREMPEGMELLQLESPQAALGKAKVLGATYRITHGLVNVDGLAATIAEIQNLEVLEIDREGKTVACDPKHENFELRVENEYLIFSIPNLPLGSFRPSELLERVGLGKLIEEGVTLQRTKVHLK